MPSLLGWALIMSVVVGVQAVQAEECTVTGVWNSSFGRLELKQKGDAVTGTFAKEENFFERITGTIQGKMLEGGAAEWQWKQSDDDHGFGMWTVSPSCRALDGKYGRTRNLELGNWFATRASSGR
jgi:hypothetical protein